MLDTRVAQDTRLGWVSAHVFHRGDLDAVLVEAVGPVVAGLSSAGALGSWFFLRYWEGGPHLRLRLRPATAEHAEEVRTRLLEGCARHLRNRPAPPLPEGALDAYREAAERWARAERLGEHDRRVRVADSVELVAYCPERRVYGEGAALAAVESHFAESSALALRLLQARLPAGRRRAVALAALMLALAVCEPSAAAAATRLGGSAVPPHSSGAEARLRDQVRQLWAAATDSAPLGGELAAWLRSVRAVHAALTVAARDGSFAPTDGASPLGHLACCAPPGTREVAAAVLRCTHLLFNRLGVHGAAETQIAGMVAGALTDLDEEE
jgi:thiopeptide-type bacteriocin biosynthesis protein